MHIGVPREIKEMENRVGVTPAGVSELVREGHLVFVETNAGVGSGFSIEQRREFHSAPCKILGEVLTVQYFEESKNLNGEYRLRFPVVKHVYENGRDV